MKNLKVYGGLTFVGRDQVRTIVAATSKRKVAELVGVPLNHVNLRWCETGNSTEIAVATSNPGTVFVASGLRNGDFKERLISKNDC